MHDANRDAIKRYLMSHQMTCLSHISPTRTLRKAAEKAPGYHPATGGGKKVFIVPEVLLIQLTLEGRRSVRNPS